MRKTISSWIDDNNNRWNCYMSKKEAIRRSKTLINCKGCKDCRNCKNCNYCKYCTNCTACEGCNQCRNCESCVNCFNCNNCEILIKNKNKSNKIGSDINKQYLITNNKFVP